MAMSFEKKATIAGLAIGVAGIVVTVIFSLPTILPLVQGSEVEVRIIRSSDVLQLNAKVPELQILFQGQDIAKSGKNLTISTIEIANTSARDIREADYDSSSGWGLVVENATLPPNALQNVSASEAYIMDKVTNLATATGDRIKLPHMLFDAGRSFKFDVIAITNAGVAPKIQSYGKVSGIAFKIVTDTKSQSAVFDWLGVVGNIAAVGGAVIAFFAEWVGRKARAARLRGAP